MLINGLQQSVERAGYARWWKDFFGKVSFEVRKYLPLPLILFEHISILTGNAPQAVFTFIFLNKAPSVLGNQPQESVFFSPPDKDRAAYSAA